VPDFTHAEQILLGIRRELDLFINMRPVRCLAERLNPLKHVRASDIDLVFFRENTEGLYCGAGGFLHRGRAEEIGLQTMMVTRRGVERILRAAFAHARTRRKRRVTLVDKANALRYAGAVWQGAFRSVAEEFPDIENDHLFVDTAALELVHDPARFDVVVTENLFGDILSDLAAALQGGLGMAASANLNPGHVSLFEPVHGSAPDLAGKGKANPLAAFLSFALLLRHVGLDELADAVGAAVERVVHDGRVTPDLGGDGSTREVGEQVCGWVLERLAA